MHTERAEDDKPADKRESRMHSHVERRNEKQTYSIATMTIAAITYNTRRRTWL